MDRSTQMLRVGERYLLITKNKLNYSITLIGIDDEYFRFVDKEKQEIVMPKENALLFIVLSTVKWKSKSDIQVFKAKAPEVLNTNSTQKETIE
jgi:hypothetical protein